MYCKFLDDSLLCLRTSKSLILLDEIGYEGRSKAYMTNKWSFDTCVLDSGDVKIIEAEFISKVDEPELILWLESMSLLILSCPRDERSMKILDLVSFSDADADADTFVSLSSDDEAPQRLYSNSTKSIIALHPSYKLVALLIPRWQNEEEGQRIILYHLLNKEIFRQIELDPEEYPTSAEFSPDGKLLLYGTSNGNVSMVSVIISDQFAKKTLFLDHIPINILKFHPKEKMLVASTNLRVYIVDLEEMNVTKVIKLKNPCLEDICICSSIDNERWAIHLASRQKVLTCSIQTGKIISKLHLAKIWQNCVSLNVTANGKQLLGLWEGKSKNTVPLVKSISLYNSSSKKEEKSSDPNNGQSSDVSSNLKSLKKRNRVKRTEQSYKKQCSQAIPSNFVNNFFSTKNCEEFRLNLLNLGCNVIVSEASSAPNGFKRAVKSLVDLKEFENFDTCVFSALLKELNWQKSGIDLEVCSLSIPIVIKVMDENLKEGETNEQESATLKAVIAYCLFLIKSFSNIINSSLRFVGRDKNNSGRNHEGSRRTVDIAREGRTRRCQQSFEAFKNLDEFLQAYISLNKENHALGSVGLERDLQFLCNKVLHLITGNLSD